MTIVGDVASDPIGYVVPLMIASIGLIENVRPLAVTTDSCTSVAGPGTGIMVVARPTPFGPRLTVCPLTMVVVGDVAPDPMRYVVPLITASAGFTVKVRPSAVTT